MTIDPDHRLASCIDGTVIHNLFSQSYRVTRFTVLEPVGLSASVSSPPRKKMKLWIIVRIYSAHFSYARIPEFCPKIVSSLSVLMSHPLTDPKLFWADLNVYCLLSVQDQKIFYINAQKYFGQVQKLIYIFFHSQTFYVRPNDDLHKKFWVALNAIQFLVWHKS